MEVLAGWFFPTESPTVQNAPYSDLTGSSLNILTESPTDLKWQIHTMTWLVHHLKYWRNHQGIRYGRSVRWRVDFFIRIANGLTDGLFHRWVRRKKLIYALSANPLLPYFSFFFLICTLPICKQPAPPPPKQKSPSSQHNKLYFLKFCGHNICILIYRQILSIFVSNSIF